MKQFVKGLNPSSKAFNYLKSCFPKLSEAKITAGIFVGPQLRQLMNDDNFPKTLARKEKRA